ncbi:adenylate/guanylate cyclase domain-containing protein [Yinghuangia sp. ASG 101]|uniref:adenylate/guanylate cyclase domain-containing protein n=1 Tax=Yinghuangia sp. ASG 101 TaxID=2896848 RepID=UPI001E41A6DF|nr:adenylate/guanylate cyclase domain-containing protein [Yinghuangia sp. ASG 101]UGQ14432.1 adenylate/guanylate cyclase domain-containing protein [Yinghuangia sp. ASG 101]
MPEESARDGHPIDGRTTPAPDRRKNGRKSSRKTGRDADRKSAKERHIRVPDPVPEGAPEPRPGAPAESPPEPDDAEFVLPSIIDVEELVLGAPRRYTSGQVAQLVGVSVEEARRMWRALGFADFGPARAFTDADVEALRHLRRLIQSGLLPEPVAAQFVRSVGQTMARFAEWQTEAWMEYLGGQRNGQRSERVMGAAEEVMPSLEPLVLYAWRRHLAAAGTRAMESATDHNTVGQRLAVGFADLVGFTRLSRSLSEAELGHVVETFEDAAADVITSLGGRLVKTLGDEVLYVAFNPKAAAELGLRLVEAIAAEPALPELRVGIAYGQVLSRMGDVFGTTVNLASRLTALAPKNTVVIDRELAAALGEVPDFDVQPMWRRPVRGLGLVEPFMVRRPGAGAPEEDTSAVPGGAGPAAP